MPWPDSVDHQSRCRLERFGSVADAVAEVHDSLAVDLGDAEVRVGFGRAHLLDVEVRSAAFGRGAYEAAAERLVERVLGGQAFDDWVGAVRSAPLPSRGPLKVVGNSDALAYPLAELGELVGAAVTGLVTGLPEHPLHASIARSEWTLFELEPKPQPDYAQQDDLVLATTCQPELLKAFLQATPIFSGRFSRHGEVFCYLKLDGEGASMDQRLAQRTALEDELNAALVAEELGCVFGNGLGLRYTYLDLALASPQRALPKVLQLARAAGVSQNCWLLPCDWDAIGQWVGIGDDSPAPPGV